MYQQLKDSSINRVKVAEASVGDKSSNKALCTYLTAFIVM